MKEQGGRLSRAAHRIHFMDGVLPLSRGKLRAEILAGVILAAVCVPQAIGYTAIAGMPVVSGLYTMLIPLALFALFGSSRHLIVGADSASAAIMATGLAAVAIAGTAQYFALAAVIALLTGLLLLLARLMRMGFLADFLSRTVILGLLTGIGIDIAIAQIPPMLGVQGGGHSLLDKIAIIIQHLPQMSIATFTIAALVIIGIFAMRRLPGKHLAMLVAVVAAIFFSWILDLGAHGVPIIGPMQAGLPQISMPQLLDVAVISQLLPTVLALFVVIIAQSASLSRAYANKHKERVDENGDILGLSLANLGASISGTFVVNGGASQTEVGDSAGARSQLSSLIVVGIVILVLLFLTTPLSFLPIAALSALVFLIGLGMINLQGLKHIYLKSLPEFGIAVFTILAIVFVGIGEAVVLAIILSLLYHVRQGYHPRNSVVTMDEHGHVNLLPVDAPQQMEPGLMIYRFNHGMYYANSELMLIEAMDLTKEDRPPVRWLCIDFSAVSDVDVSSALTLQQIFEDLSSRRIKLVFISVSPHVMTELRRFEVIADIGEGSVFEDIDEVITNYKNASEDHS
ncbi:MAG: SulP family inorganic anion transporter [Methanomassiliicoccales archaeon]